jgi:hypothetical protein
VLPRYRRAPTEANCRYAIEVIPKEATQAKMVETNEKSKDD